MPALAVAARSLSRELAGEAHREQAEQLAVPDVLPGWLVEDRVDRAREQAVTVEADRAP
jgi:hypothetical protein